jgi:hypothetical protein
MHARAFQACFDHQLIAAFHDATPNRPTLGLKLGGLHLLFAFFQVSQVARDDFSLVILALQVLYFHEQVVRPFLFQVVQPFTQPGLAFWGMFAM